jgi:PilZ domain
VGEIVPCAEYAFCNTDGWPRYGVRKPQERNMTDESSTESTIEDRRKSKRKYVLFKIPAYDAETKRFLGLVQDINETGVQLFGVRVDVDATKTLVIQASDYVKGAPLIFEAVCRWTRRENPQGYYVSGFEISSISDESKKNLLKLIEAVAFG